MNHLLYRHLDVITNKNDLELLYTHKNFPILMGCTDSPTAEDVLEDMNWYISKSSGVLQLNPVIRKEVLYEKSHGAGTVGKLWGFHHQEFSKFILTNNVKNVLEIGSHHTILADNCISENKKLEWTIIDPMINANLSNKTKIIKRFFDDTVEMEVGSYDTIIHSHLLEHMHDPIQFLTQINNKLKSGQKMIFSIPNMEVMLKRNYTNCLNFEHTVFFSEKLTENILNRTNFVIVNKQYFLDDHSIFYCVEKQKCSISKEVDDYGFNKNLYLKFIDNQKINVQRINQIISNIPVPIFLFGGHIFSQYLISYGLNVNKIINILDNDVNKWSKRLYGTDLYVDTPSVLKNYKTASVILSSGIYNKEIQEDILTNINKNVTFIE